MTPKTHGKLCRWLLWWWADYSNCEVSDFFVSLIVCGGNGNDSIPERKGGTARMAHSHDRACVTIIFRRCCKCYNGRIWPGVSRRDNDRVWQLLAIDLWDRSSIVRKCHWADNCWIQTSITSASIFQYIGVACLQFILYFYVACGLAIEVNPILFGDVSEK